MTDYAHPDEELLRSIDIHQLLPQQEPFVMVGCLTGFGTKSSTTETRICGDNIFVDDGFFSAAGILENIAQTCAARVGYYNKYVLNNEVQTGFIGAIREYSIAALPAVGDTITTRVDVVEEVFGMTLANVEVSCGGRTIATAEIKLSTKNMS